MIWFLIHFIFGIFISKVYCSESGKCGTKLLNDYDKVPDSAFSASSYFTLNDHNKKKADFSAKAARESYDKDNQEYAWCPLNQVETSLSEYLEIDLGRSSLVKVVQTKGRFAQEAGKEFTPFYKIRYSRDADQHWRDYKKFKDKGFQEILNGPNDAFLDAFETLDPPIVARWVRIFPYSHKPKRVCLKVQLFGCDFSNDIIEYRMIQGTPALISDSMLESQHLKSFSDTNYPCMDNGYDGNYYGGHLQDGLGLLTDNVTGVRLMNRTKDLFRFVGWYKDSLSQINEFITIKFIFTTDRNFTSVKLYSYSSPPMQVDYFSRIHIMFSDDDQSYDRRIIKTDLLHQFRHDDYSILISLHGYYGRFVKISLYFQSQWLLLSEVVFNSNPRSSDHSISNKSALKYSKLFRNHGSSPPATVPKHNNTINSKVRYHIITTIPPNSIDRPVNLEIVYLLTILLCLLLGVITVIFSFWIIVKRRRYQRKKSIKKQALALCSQPSFIPYNHNSSSIQCLATSHAPASISPLGIFQSYTVDRRNFQNGTLRTVPNLPGYHSHGALIDQSGITNKYCNGDPNIYTSIIGSDNDSSLSPEYATTSVTNEFNFPNTCSDTSTLYLPTPIEPIRSDGYSGSIINNSDRPSHYYPHPNTLPNPHDSVNIWRITGNQCPDTDRTYNPHNQMSFNDYPFMTFNTNTSSKYNELPSINSYF